MSFSSDTKRELCRKEPADQRTLLAETYGFLICCKNMYDGRIEFHTENSAVGARFSENLQKSISVIVEIQRNLTSNAEKVQMVVSIPDTDDSKKINRMFSNIKIETSAGLNGFFTGVFLACGTITNPQKDYHLEFVFYDAKSSDLLFKKLSEAGFTPKITFRKGQIVIYIKDKQEIEDFLGHIGALEAYWKFFNVAVEKEIRNDANRRANCDSANINKTVNAASRQLDAIRKIDERVSLNKLSDELKEIAILRIENPELTLRELTELLGGKISKSGLNHRLNKIISIADSLD